MTTTTYSSGTPAPLKLFFIAAIIAAASIAWMVVDTAASHAAARHAAVAEAVRECMGPDQQNALQKWHNPETGRTAFLCQLPTGKFGLQIGYESGDVFNEITNFIKDQMNRIEQVAKYLSNRGYVRVK